MVINDTENGLSGLPGKADLVDAATMKPIRTYTFITRERNRSEQGHMLKKKVEAPLEPAMISANQMTRVTRGVPNVIRN